MINWLIENYKYILVSLISCVVTYALQPVATSKETFHATTKVDVKTKTVTKTQVRNDCVAKVEIKPDGSQIISATSNQTTSSNNATSTSNASETSLKPLGSTRPVSLGVRYYTSPKWPPSVSKESIGVSVGVPMGTDWRLEAGYRFNNTISLGIHYEF